MHPEEVMWMDEKILAYLYIHDPRSLENPFSEGIGMLAGYVHQIHVTMVRRISDFNL